MEHGYSFLPDRVFSNVICVGGAFGHELIPIIKKCKEITILEPAEGFRSIELCGVRINYVKPLPSGILPFDDKSFDLITCFGVLHHVPNVSTVMKEFHRTLRPNGFLLIREPEVSMGDWRKPRKGGTKREKESH